jgi:hypothetical protein
MGQRAYAIDYTIGEAIDATTITIGETFEANIAKADSDKQARGQGRQT